MGDFSGFFYGTLIFPQILKRVITKNRPNVETSIDFEGSVPAVLKGYKRHKVHNADYPAVLRTDNEEDETHGVLVRGLTARDILQLDIFEGPQYVRTDVEVHIPEESRRNSEVKHVEVSEQRPINDGDAADDGEADDFVPIPTRKTVSVPAQAYVWIDSPALLDNEDWDPEEFKTKLRAWLADDHEEFLED